jgi:hypothetical protein
MHLEMLDQRFLEIETKNEVNNKITELKRKGEEEKETNSNKNKDDTKTPLSTPPSEDEQKPPLAPEDKDKKTILSLHKKIAKLEQEIKDLKADKENISPVEYQVKMTSLKTELAKLLEQEQASFSQAPHNNNSPYI